MGHRTASGGAAANSVISVERNDQAKPTRRRSSERCEWCGQHLPDQDGVGRRRRYCGQSCRQRAYEDRHALSRRELPLDSVVLSVAQRDDLADRLYQVSCAAEDVATALAESASREELTELVGTLLALARAAEHIR